MKGFPSFSLIFSITIFLMLAQSSLAFATQLVDLSGFPKWFTDAYATDKTVAQKSTLEIAELSINAEVKGKATLGSKSDGYWYYTFDIGTTAPVECYFFTSFDGPANSLSTMIDATIPELEKLNQKTLASRNNFALDIGMTDQTPYIKLDTLYSMGEGSGLVSGVLKGLSARTGDSLQICFHNELGYEGAFFEVFESVIAAATASKQNEAFFKNVYSMNINGIPMGYALETHALDEDGDVYSRQETAMIVPVDASSISKTDTIAEEFGGTDGSMINRYEYTVENGVLASEFSLSIVDDRWEVSGQVQGKEIKTKLEYNEWLLTGYGGYLANAALLTGEEQKASYYTWMAEADPTAAIELSLSKIEDNENANLEVTVGPLKFDYLAQPDGSVTNVKMGMGGIEMNMTSIYQSGSPALE